MIGWNWTSKLWHPQTEILSKKILLSKQATNGIKVARNGLDIPILCIILQLQQ